MHSLKARFYQSCCVLKVGSFKLLKYVDYVNMNGKKKESAIAMKRQEPLSEPPSFLHWQDRAKGEKVQFFFNFSETKV